MDWTLAIDRNRDALLRMLALLLSMTGSGAGAVVPRYVYNEALRILRPAESAFRRLIVIAAYVWRQKIRAGKPRPGLSGPVTVTRGEGERAPVFALFDRRKHFNFNNFPPVTRGNPRVWTPGMDYPVFETKVVPTPYDPVSAARLCRRLQALQRALGDLPAQARRLARWRAKRERAAADAVKYPPMRPGNPPGHRARKWHEVDEILSNCHALALYVLHDPPDTS